MKRAKPAARRPKSIPLTDPPELWRARKAFNHNRARVDVEIMRPYMGMMVAWATDGTRIVDGDMNYGVLLKRLEAAGEDVQNLVFERLD